LISISPDQSRAAVAFRNEEVGNLIRVPVYSDENFLCGIGRLDCTTVQFVKAHFGPVETAGEGYA